MIKGDYLLGGVAVHGGLPGPQRCGIDRQVYLRYYGTSTIPRYLYQAAAAFS